MISEAAQPSTVLLVEDEPLIRWTSRRLIERLGLRVTDVPSCRQAEEIWASGACNAVVTDYRLPDGAGTELIAKMRATGRREPAVVATAETDKIPLALMSELAISALIRKPLEADALKDALGSLLDGKARPENPGCDASLGRFHVVSLQGALTPDNLQNVRSIPRRTWVALDLSNTLYADAGASDALRAIAQEQRHAGGLICLINVAPALHSMLKREKMDQHVDIFSDTNHLRAIGHRLTTACERASVIESVVIPA
jgi:CheY-like chemotaxis protein/anti-anti-sigma regulatory factor